MYIIIQYTWQTKGAITKQAIQSQLVHQHVHMCVYKEVKYIHDEQNDIHRAQWI